MAVTVLTPYGPRAITRYYFPAFAGYFSDWQQDLVGAVGTHTFAAIAGTKTVIPGVTTGTTNMTTIGTSILYQPLLGVPCMADGRPLAIHKVVLTAAKETAQASALLAQFDLVLWEKETGAAQAVNATVLQSDTTDRFTGAASATATTYTAIDNTLVDAPVLINEGQLWGKFSWTIGTTGNHKFNHYGGVGSYIEVYKS